MIFQSLFSLSVSTRPFLSMSVSTLAYPVVIIWSLASILDYSVVPHSNSRQARRIILASFASEWVVSDGWMPKAEANFPSSTYSNFCASPSVLDAF